MTHSRVFLCELAIPPDCSPVPLRFRLHRPGPDETAAQTHPSWCSSTTAGEDTVTRKRARGTRRSFDEASARRSSLLTLHRRRRWTAVHFNFLMLAPDQFSGSKGKICFLLCRAVNTTNISVVIHSTCSQWTKGPGHSAAPLTSTVFLSAKPGWAAAYPLTSAQ